MILQTGKSNSSQNGFTFLEVMLTVVILAVGLVGIYRAFLISMNYQQYITERLYVINFLSDEFARTENFVITKTALSAVSSKSPIPWKTRSGFFLERRDDPLSEALEGLSTLELKLYMSRDNKTQEFTRRSLVYVHDK